MRIRDFLLLVYDALPPLLPKPLREHHWRVRFSLLQVYYETAAVHYEVWVQRKTQRIEIGLHFEGEREANERWAALLAPRALEIQAQLGPRVELEDWTNAWMRLHEALPFDGKLSEELAQQIAERLARFIAVLEPICAEERKGVRA